MHDREWDIPHDRRPTSPINPYYLSHEWLGMPPEFNYLIALIYNTFYNPRTVGSRDPQASRNRSSGEDRQIYECDCRLTWTRKLIACLMAEWIKIVSLNLGQCDRNDRTVNTVSSIAHFKTSDHLVHVVSSLGKCRSFVVQIRAELPNDVWSTFGTNGNARAGIAQKTNQLLARIVLQ